LHERLNAEIADQHGGGSLADDRGELLATQARARAAEHRRRQAERAAAKARQALADDPPGPPAAVVADPERPLSAQERHEAAEFAANRRTVWLPAPVTMPGTQRRVFAYDPANVPEWLREVLDAAA
jgi:hypothetical protein